MIEDAGLNDAGQYNLTLLRLPDGPLGYAGDPDGGPLASGQTLAGQSHAASDLDAYQFYGQARDRVVVAAVRTSGAIDTRILIYPESGGPAEAQSNCSFGCADRLEQRLLTTGLYTIVVEDSGLEDAGSYQLTLLKLPGAITYTADGDGGTFSSATTEVFPGWNNQPSDMDAFHFYGDAGDRVLITAVAANGPIDTRILLYPEGGEPVEAQSNCSFGCADQLDVQLARRGLYTIVIEDSGLDGQGSYRCSLTRIPPQSQPGLYDPHPPEAGIALAETPAPLSWAPVAGATGYDLYFGSAATQPMVLLARNLPAATYPMPPLALNRSYTWHVEALAGPDTLRGPVWRFYAISVNGQPDEAGEPPPLAVWIGQSYPNPFNPSTTIPFYLPGAAMVELRIYDVTGALVKTLLHETMPAGGHRASWFGTNESGERVPGSVYFYELRAGTETRAGKLALVE